MYSKSREKEFNCPQCGYLLSIHFKFSKLVKCYSCGSSIFLEDDSAKLIGKSSTLSAEPSLIKLHSPFRYEGKSYLPLGKIRYSYGRGFWEEWFLKDDENQEFWLSIDEGDFSLEQKRSFSYKFKSIDTLVIGNVYGGYIVEEKGFGECVGFEGELPENIEIGEKHYYAHLSKGNGILATVESFDNKVVTYMGRWIDPFKIEVKG